MSLNYIMKLMISPSEEGNWAHIQSNSFYFQLTNAPNHLECFVPGKPF